MDKLKFLYFVEDDSGYAPRFPGTQGEAIESENIAMAVWESWNEEFPARLFRINLETNMLSVYDIEACKWEWVDVYKMYFAVRRWLDVGFPKKVIMTDGIFAKYDEACQFIERNKPEADDWKLYSFDQLQYKFSEREKLLKLEQEEKWKKNSL